jgi:hypothetical protein
VGAGAGGCRTPGLTPGRPGRLVVVSSSRRPTRGRCRRDDPRSA